MSLLNNKNTGRDEFLASFQQGGEKGMTYIFNHYYKRLCLYANTILDDHQAAEDVVQDVFARIWGNKIKMRNPAGISSFLYSMVRYACYNYIRDNKARRNWEANSIFVGASTEHDFINKLIFTETLYEIYNTMISLPPKCREIFRMLYIQGKGFTQIAQELNVAESTVRVQKAKAIAIIKQKLHLLLLIGLITGWSC